MTNKNEKFNKIWTKIIAKAWADENYKKNLIANPKEVLKKEGIETPKNLNLRIVEDTPDTQTLIIPTAKKHNSETNINKIENRIAAGGIGGGGLAPFSNL
ncbi:NHLP leader peptide family natural product precursor [bacterium]|nr:NHLP leader peptide family natural product precursor [bacterium]